MFPGIPPAVGCPSATIHADVKYRRAGVNLGRILAESRFPSAIT